MGPVNLIILTLLIGCVFGVRGSCIHVENEEMLEYSCIGGHPSDLNAIPERTEKIRINRMLIPHVSADIFSRFGENLWVLSCSQCGIINIKPDAFKRLVNLQQLSLDNNHLSAVRGVWFENLNSLTYLDLNYNDIDTIEDEVFENLPSLVDLRIAGNRLQCLNLNAMNHLTDLKRIFLSENKEFRCPNAVSKFLQDREVNFEPDLEWRKMPVDGIQVPIPSPVQYTTTPIPLYHRRKYPPRVLATTEPDHFKPDATGQVVTYPTHDHPTFRLPTFSIDGPVTTSATYLPDESTTYFYDQTATKRPDESFMNRIPVPATYPPHDSFTDSPPESTTYPSYMVSTHGTTSSPSEIILYPPHDPSSQLTPEPVTTFPLYTYPPESMTNVPDQYTQSRPYYPLPYITSTSVPSTNSWEPWTEFEYPVHRYPNKASESPSLATSRTDQKETSMNLNPEHASTDLSGGGMTIDTSDYFFHPQTIDDLIQAIHENDGSAMTTATTHVVRPYVPVPTAPQFSPDDYYERLHEMSTPHYPEENHAGSENPVPAVVPMETGTTTDKPLPECPSSSPIAVANFSIVFAIVIASILRNVFVKEV